MRTWLRLTIALLALLGATGACPPDFARLGIQPLKQEDRSKTLFQLIRSNAGHYWAHMRMHPPASLKPYLSYSGIVTGDPHPGNFLPVLVRLRSGRRATRFQDVDLDDAGRGPFALDFTRFVVAAESMDRKIKKRVLEAAYLRGLQGRKMNPPKRLGKALRNLSAKKHEDRITNYAERWTDGDAILLVKGETEALGRSAPRQAVAEAVRPGKLIDMVARVKERGGSAEAQRYIALVEEGGRRRIIEFKERLTPGLSFYQPQSDTLEWAQEAQAALQPDASPPWEPMVKLGEKYFWVRQKPGSPLELDFNDPGERKFLREIAEYDAYHLGLIHGRQAGAEGYAEKIAADTETFHAALETAAEDYIKLMKDAYKR